MEDSLKDSILGTIVGTIILSLIILFIFSLVTPKTAIDTRKTGQIVIPIVCFAVSATVGAINFIGQKKRDNERKIASELAKRKRMAEIRENKKRGIYNI
jgi:hypothetical protein